MPHSTRRNPGRLHARLASGLALLLVGGASCKGSDNSPIDAGPGADSGGPIENVMPPRITNLVGPNSYDGSSDDLLTAGLGKTGLVGAAPGFVDAQNPTTAELRRRAIYTNYRGILDITAAGGYGTLYGPNIDVNGHDTLGEGKIAGKEYLAYADDGSGSKNVGLLVQIPQSFDAKNPCIVTAPSSGSRGVYGAIGTAGEWGLKHGCAVAYTDVGKGVGYYDAMTDRVMSMDGHLLSRAAAGLKASFAPAITQAAHDGFNAAFPNRIAYKHVHSQQNPEKDWGQNVLDSIRFAFWVLNEEYSQTTLPSGKKAQTILPANTLVIASSISNGGGESLLAAEQDTEGLIDGVAVSEPNAQPKTMTGVTVNFGGSPVVGAGKPLVDFFVFRMIYEPCAALSVHAQAPNGIRPGWLGAGTAATGTAATMVSGVELETIAQNRCQSLADKGLVSGATTADQADSALAKMQAYGWSDPVSVALIASHYRIADIYVAFGYVAAYGKFSFTDNVCGFSLANVDATGSITAQLPATQAILYAIGNGLNSGGEVVYNDSMGGAKSFHVGVSPSTGRVDGSLDGLLCLRDMVTGVDAVTGAALTGAALANSQRVQAGLRDVLMSGGLHNKPTIIVAGRSDALLPVNNAARAYVAFNSKVEGSRSDMHYYEIQNGNHFDAFLPNAAAGGVNGYDALLVPVHFYFMNAMDLMWAKLKSGTALPPSQVVRTTPRGGTAGSAPAITAANVPKISASPAAADAIIAIAGALNVPN